MSDLFIRDHQAEDIADVFEMNSDPLVQAFIGGVKTYQESEAGLNYVLENRHRFAFPLKAIVHARDGKVIGYCGMQSLKDFGPELFFGLNSRYWGKGYCRQAVLLYLEKEAADLGTIFATVHPDNARSRHVLETVGFGFEKEVYYEPRRMKHCLYSLRRGS